jgi:WD40 repeat protein
MVTVASVDIVPLSGGDHSGYAGRMRTRYIAVLLLNGVLTGACATTQAVDEKAAADVKGKPGAYLTGTPIGLGSPSVVNRRDFVYAVDFGADDVVAFVHHVSTNMELTATQVDPVRPRFQQPVNASEFDVEDVVVIDAGPAKGQIAVPSRQGIARSFDAVSGKTTHELITGVALVRVAASPDGGLLAYGGADGRVFLVDAGTFAIRGQGRLHDDEVRGLAFLADGRLVSASLDKTLKVSALGPATDATVHMPASALKSGERVFLAHVDGAQAIATVRDTRQPACAITTAAAKRLGLAPKSDGLVPVVTAAGASEASGVIVPKLLVQTLELGTFDAAVCDACVPAGAELVLGGTALAKASFVDDIARDEIVVKPTEGPDAAVLSAGALAITAGPAVSLPGFGTDVDVSRSGSVLVSFSHARAERSFDTNDAERKGVYPPATPQSGAALVDIAGNKLARMFVSQHLGFTVTAGISPDGHTIATGGWDKRVIVWDASTGQPVTEREVAWLVRRLRFSPDGRLLAVAAWTPVNALNEGNSEPALLLYPVALADAKVAQ